MYKRRYYWKRRDVALKIQKKWREDNKEQVMEYRRRYYYAMNLTNYMKDYKRRYYIATVIYKRDTAK